MNTINNYILGLTDIINISPEDETKEIRLTKHESVRNALTKRKRDSHKGTYGKVGMLSGSKGMAGAAVLNLNAALRSGSGLVKGCIPDTIYDVVETASIESLTYPFDENNISFEELDKELLQFSDVIATGSGSTNLKAYKRILEFILVNSKKPLVIDAEGINLLNLDLLKNHEQNIVLTPHYGEMARLINKDTDYIRENIIDVSRGFSYLYNVFLVLKGARTIIAVPDGRIFVNTTGNPGMATAGSGDVLTGIIASLIGQKIETTDALKTAVYLHGLAGDIASRNVGEYSLIASDLIKYLPEAMLSL